MSFIVQPVEAPSIFKIQETVNQGANGLVTFNVAYEDIIFYNGIASGNTILNIVSQTGASLDSSMSVGDVVSLQYKTINATASYGVTEIQIDGSSTGVTVSTFSGSSLVSGIAGRVNTFVFEITKTNTNTWYVETQTENFGTGQVAATFAPTVGTPSLNASGISVPFTLGGNSADLYLAYSNPSSINAVNIVSPIQIPGASLTVGQSYTFQVKAGKPGTYGPPSNSSSAITWAIVGQQEYISPGTFTFVAPADVTSVSVVAVGGGAAAQPGGGGGLGYKNAITVIPASSYTVFVGATGQSSYFGSAGLVLGGGGSGLAGGVYLGDGGGNGGASPGNGINSTGGGGGGAGGYSGNGGAGGFPNNGDPSISWGKDGSGGGGGGGGAGWQNGNAAGSGGGVGILGQGSNGIGGSIVSNTQGNKGTSGSGGTDFAGKSTPGLYGGGSGGFTGRQGQTGAVRVIYPGTTRAFPSTNTGNL